MRAELETIKLHQVEEEGWSSSTPGKDDNEGGNVDEEQTEVSTKEQTERLAIIQAEEQVPFKSKE